MNNQTPVLLFSLQNHDTVWNDNKITFRGQRAIYVNDYFFEDPNQPFWIFKRNNNRWLFLGEGYVVSQNKKRIKDNQQPIVPEWTLSYKMPVEFVNWNRDLALRTNNNNYLTKNSIFSYIQEKTGISTNAKNAHQLGIVTVTRN